MKRGTLIVGLFLVGLLVLTGCASDDNEKEQEIQEIIDEYNILLVNKNLAQEGLEHHMGIFAEGEGAWTDTEQQQVIDLHKFMKENISVLYEYKLFIEQNYKLLEEHASVNVVLEMEKIFESLKTWAEFYTELSIIIIDGQKDFGWWDYYDVTPIYYPKEPPIM
jgi:hypothetical protein